MFIFSDTIQKADGTLKLEAGYLRKNIRKPNRLIDIGIAAKIICYIVGKSQSVEEAKLYKFYQGVLQFFSVLTSHMIEKCLLKHIICGSPCLKPTSRAI